MDRVAAFLFILTRIFKKQQVAGSSPARNTMTLKQKEEIKELELTLFSTGKFSSRSEAYKAAIEKYKIQLQKQQEANKKSEIED